MLMPAALIEHASESTGKDFDELCRMFKSSQSAMGKRLHRVI